MKKLGFIGLWLAIAGLIFGASYGWIKLDLWMNPWIYQTEFEWVRLVTTHHGITMLYLHNSDAAFLVLGGVDLLISGIFIISLALKLRDY